jgi:hypothetical protein
MTKKSSKKNNKKKVSKVSKRKVSKVSKKKGSKVSKRKVSKRKVKRKRHKSSGKKTKKQKLSGGFPPLTQDPTITVRCHNIGVASQEIDHVNISKVDTLYKKIKPQFKDPAKTNDTGGYIYDEIKPQAYLPNINSQGLESYLDKLFKSSDNNPNLLLLQEVFFEEYESLYQENYFNTFGIPMQNEIVKKIHLKRKGPETMSDEEKINVTNLRKENKNNIIGNNQYVRYTNSDNFQLVQLESSGTEPNYKCLSSNLVIVFDKSRFTLLHFDVLGTKRGIICVLQDNSLDINLIVVNLQLKINDNKGKSKNDDTIKDLKEKIPKLKAQFTEAKIILGGDFNDDYFHPNVKDVDSYKTHVQAFSNVPFENYDEVRKGLENFIDNVNLGFPLTNVFHDNPESTNYFPESKLKKTEKKVDFLFTDMESTEPKIYENSTSGTRKYSNGAGIPEETHFIPEQKFRIELTDENFHQFGDHNALQAVLKN